VFHPDFKALQFKCEGLASGVASSVDLALRAAPKTSIVLAPVADKNAKTIEVPSERPRVGCASSYDVLHVESDLREPIKELN